MSRMWQRLLDKVLPRSSILSILMSVLMITVAVTLLFTAVTLIVNERDVFRKLSLRFTSTLAGVVGRNSTAALAFADQKAANDIMSGLSSEHEILLGCLYTREGILLASYNARAETVVCPSQPPLEGGHFERGHLGVTQNIRQDEDVLGTIYLLSNMTNYNRQLQNYVVILCSVLLTAALLAYLLSLKLQKLVTGPILKLTETMRFISQKGLYSLRAEKSSEAEINALVISFNHMLDVIQEREDLVRQSEEQFRAAFEMAAVGHVLVGREGQFLRVNSEIRRLLGYTDQELLSMKFSDITFPEDIERSAVILRSLFAGTQSSYVFEKRFVTKQGEKLWVIISTAAIADASGKVTSVVSVVQDITERKRVEKERDRLLLDERKARFDAEKSVKVRDEFLSIASHELRTPIAPIKMHMEMMRLEMEKIDVSSFPAASGLLRAFDISERQIENLERLTQDLLDVSRITAGRLILNLRDVDLRDLVDGVIERSQLLIQRSGSKVNLVYPVSSVSVHGQWDPMRIEQIVMNLLTNALKYGLGQPIEIKISVLNAEVLLQVKDSGIGIARSDQEKIFERFGRVASLRHYPGLGLGLYITQELVRAHGGRIQVESETGKGALFSVFLPIVK